MSVQATRSSQRPPARIIGFFYLVLIVAAAFAEPFVREKLIVAGNAAATASNILSSEQLFRWGGVADFVNTAGDLIVGILLYYLLAPVNRPVALLAVAFRLVHVAIMAINVLLHFGSLLLLKGAPYLSGFTIAQLQASSLFSLNLLEVGYNIALLYFGVHCILIGYLVVKSTFLPRIIGLLMIVGGLGYEVNSLVHLALPPLPFQLFPYIMLPGFFAELGFALWLLVMGVNVSRWREQARAGMSTF